MTGSAYCASDQTLSDGFLKQMRLAAAVDETANSTAINKSRYYGDLCMII